MTEESYLFAGPITFVGGGVMGEAIARGWIESKAVDAGQVTIAEPSAGRRDVLASLGAIVVDSAERAMPADLVVLAVKPQVVEPVVAALGDRIGDALVVSIAAGVSTARLESLLPVPARVVRVMPNTPAMVGAGVAVISGGSEATSEDVEAVRRLFAAIGEAVVIDERYQNAAGAISGCGPAYFALVVEALSRAGVSVGLPRAVAQQLAIHTMQGTAKMLDETNVHPELLIDGVTSPGGTTIAALNELEAAGIRTAFADAIAAAVSRSEELG